MKPGTPPYLTNSVKEDKVKKYNEVMRKYGVGRCIQLVVEAVYSFTAGDTYF